MTSNGYNTLPLETFRQLMGLSPWHFWGLGNSRIPRQSTCDSIVQQHSWQDTDAVGREQIVEAIATAEGLLREYLHFWPAPRYSEETVAWQGSSLAWDGWQTVQLPDGYVHAIGTEKYTSIGTVTTADSTLVFSDQDGDSLNDTFIATVTVAADTNPLSLGCYFVAADRLDGEPISERWRIAPTTVTVSGTTATLRGRFWQLVKPILYEGVQGTTVNGLDPNSLANIVSELGIFQRTTDPTGTTVATAQGYLTFESHPCHGWWCCCSSCIPNGTDPAATATALARVGIRDARHGIVTPGQATYNVDTGEWSGAYPCWAWTPDTVTIRYLSGFPLDARGQMDRDMAMIVARLAAAELARPICACADAQAEQYRWQYDLTLAGESDKIFSTNDIALTNPLGTRRGHVFAWKQIQQREQLRGILA